MRYCHGGSPGHPRSRHVTGGLSTLYGHGDIPGFPPVSDDDPVPRHDAQGTTIRWHGRPPCTDTVASGECRGTPGRKRQ